MANIYAKPLQQNTLKIRGFSIKWSNGSARCSTTPQALTKLTGGTSKMAIDKPSIAVLASRINPLTGRSGPAPDPPRDGDQKQARRRINVEVRTGRRPHPNTFPCALCGHVWTLGERRHEYDHYLGYAAEYHYTVRPVCTKCHASFHNQRTTLL